MNRDEDIVNPTSSHSSDGAVSFQSDYPIGKYDGYSLKEAGLMLDEALLKEVFADKPFYIHQNASNGFDYGAPLNADNLQGTFTQLCALQPIECNVLDYQYINFCTLQAYKRTDLETDVLYANYKPYSTNELEPYIIYENDTYIVYDMLPLLINTEINVFIYYQCQHKTGGLDCDCLSESAIDWIVNVRKNLLTTTDLIVKGT